MNLNKRDTLRKIGIWGFGIVGKSALNYFTAKEFDIEVLDKREFTPDEKEFLNAHKIKYYYQKNPEDIELFLERNDLILSSPGIDLRNYIKYKNKFISELDLFFKAWQAEGLHSARPAQIIGVTGTLGKTSVVNLLSQILLKSGLKVATGGNIGTGMLDLINSKNNSKDLCEYALLELSSFQLDQIKQCEAFSDTQHHFAPDLAIWTNFYDNHLDRHGSMQEYFNAKFSILAYQNADQQALINWQLKDLLFSSTNFNLENRSLYFFFTEIDQNLRGASLSSKRRTTQPPVHVLPNLDDLREQDTLYCIENQHIVKFDISGKKIIYKIENLPSISYLTNWIIIAAAADILNISLDQIDLSDLSLPTHRLQHVATINSIEYFNDSKSTLAQSTLAAIDQFKNKSIHLFLGGISKGVDRLPLINEISNKVKSIYCFGSEAQLLYSQCIKKNINSYKFDSLQEAFKECLKNAQKNDIVLFSPSGASYDQFKNYQERGNYFVSLVKNLESQT